MSLSLVSREVRFSGVLRSNPTEAHAHIGKHVRCARCLRCWLIGVVVENARRRALLLGACVVCYAEPLSLRGCNTKGTPFKRHTRVGILYDAILTQRKRPRIYDVFCFSPHSAHFWCWRGGDMR